MPVRVVILSVLIFYAGIVNITQAYAAGDLSSLQVHFFDISDGECTLIQFPNGYTLLVDAGSKKSGAEVIQHLHERNVQKIDTLVLTGQMEVPS